MAEGRRAFKLIRFVQRRRVRQRLLTKRVQGIPSGLGPEMESIQRAFWKKLF